MVLVEPIDLTSTTFATLSFWTRWEIETGYDYVQVFVNDGGSGWTPLSGRYTKAGNSNQATGEPLFDGFQTEWVKEEMILTNYVGKEIQLRFHLKSDTYVTEDGYFWDDMTVTIVDDFVDLDERKATDIVDVTVFPNPVADQLNVRYELFDKGNGLTLSILNATGQVMESRELNSGAHQVRVDVSGYANGIYFYQIRSGSEVISSDKFIR
jgi:hypothetical protein